MYLAPIPSEIDPKNIELYRFGRLSQRNSSSWDSQKWILDTGSHRVYPAQQGFEIVIGSFKNMGFWFSLFLYPKQNADGYRDKNETEV